MLNRHLHVPFPRNLPQAEANFWIGDPRNTEVFLSEAGGSDVQCCVRAVAEWVVSSTALSCLHVAGLLTQHFLKWLGIYKYEKICREARAFPASLKNAVFFFTNVIYFHLKSL